MAWKLAQSAELGTLYAAPGNPGIARHAEIAPLDVGDHAAVAAFCGAHRIGLVVVGPEAPLVAGLADDLVAAGIPVFGPSRAAAQLEGSKAFTKALCRDADIPTAGYAVCATLEAVRAEIARRAPPFVVKDDGLAAGKGVTIAVTREEAMAAAEAGLADTGDRVVIEDFLDGEEASFFAVTDGTAIVPLGTAQDHKRVGEGDTGPNTGGMGAYAPAPVMTEAMVEQTVSAIVRPTVAAMAARGTPYLGVLYAGLMITDEGPKLIEYNVRFGDPEAQVLLLRLESDLLEIMLATVEGRLAAITPAWSDEAALTVVMAAAGYPGPPTKGTAIGGLDAAEALDGVTVFQAGTASGDGGLVATGGRVLNVTGRGATLAEARDRAYAGIDRIDWPDGFCRRDIGWRALTARDAG